MDLELNLFSNTKNFSQKEDIQTDRVLFEWVSEEKIRIVREYTRDENSTYLLNHRTSVENLNEYPVQLDKLKLHLGSAFQIPTSL